MDKREAANAADAANEIYEAARVCASRVANEREDLIKQSEDDSRGYGYGDGK